jgi:4a-hydroxytetrahydrobiopterin dehydratase
MPQNVPSGWALEGNALTRTIERADFVNALAFVLEVGRLAEEANHHPDIDIRYRTVRLSLSTHSAGSTVTEKDYALAEEINDLSEERIRLITDEVKLRFHF